MPCDYWGQQSIEIWLAGSYLWWCNLYPKWQPRHIDHSVVGEEWVVILSSRKPFASSFLKKLQPDIASKKHSRIRFSCKRLLKCPRAYKVISLITLVMRFGHGPSRASDSMSSLVKRSFGKPGSIPSEHKCGAALRKRTRIMPALYDTNRSCGIWSRESISRVLPIVSCPYDSISLILLYSSLRTSSSYHSKHLFVPLHQWFLTESQYPFPYLEGWHSRGLWWGFPWVWSLSALAPSKT